MDLDLYTRVPTPALPLTPPIVTLGSCFAQAIATRLQHHAVGVDCNPLGTLFNPISIANTIKYALTGWQDPSKYVRRDQEWVSYLYHSKIHAATPPALTARIAQANALFREQLRAARTLIVTFGTTITFRHDGQVVANCHRQPNAEFQRAIEPIDTLLQHWTEVHTLLLAHNPTLRIILTVSPIRHTLSGALPNAVSKARALILAHGLALRLTSIDYFPAFEILIDELRDYRFYAENLTHPAPEAEEIICSRILQRPPSRCASLETPPDDHAPRIRLKERTIVQTEKLPPLAPNTLIVCHGGPFAKTLANFFAQRGFSAYHHDPNDPHPEPHTCTTAPRWSFHLLDIQDLHPAHDPFHPQISPASLKAMQRDNADVLCYFISPIRHIGTETNSLVKAKLLSMAFEIPTFRENMFYLPFYEIINDELRDYRFYQSDLITPSRLALQLIMQRILDAKE